MDWILELLFGWAKDKAKDKAKEKIEEKALDAAAGVVGKKTVKAAQTATEVAQTAKEGYGCLTWFISWFNWFR